LILIVGLTDAKKKERKQKREEQKKKLNAAAAKRKAKQPVIAEGANPYINPNKKAGLPLPGTFQLPIMPGL